MPSAASTVSIQRRTAGRHPRQDERHADVAAGPQGHRRAEGEARGHQVGAVLPGDRDIRRHPGKDVRQGADDHFGDHQRRQRHEAKHAEPAVEPAQHVDAVEQRTQQRGRAGVRVRAAVHQLALDLGEKALIGACEDGTFFMKSAIR